MRVSSRSSNAATMPSPRETKKFTRKYLGCERTSPERKVNSRLQNGFLRGPLQELATCTTLGVKRLPSTGLHRSTFSGVNTRERSHWQARLSRKRPQMTLRYARGANIR